MSLIINVVALPIFLAIAVLLSNDKQAINKKTVKQIGRALSFRLDCHSAKRRQRANDFVHFISCKHFA